MGNKKKKFLIISISILVLVILIFLLNFCCSILMSTGTIHYYDNYQYDIIIHKSTIKVQKNEVVQCIKAPCPVRKMKTNTIMNKSEYQSTINNILSGNDEVTITRSDISNEEYEILLEIINKG